MATVETIRSALQAAREIKALTATFHAMVLIYADELSGHDPHAFCREVGIDKAFHIEFRKMLAAAKELRKQGYAIVPKTS